MGPFERHLRDAIALNRERAPRYAALSAGASRPISRALIAGELLLLPVARWFDRRAEQYHRAGVPLLDALFVSMDETPAFGSVTIGRDATGAAPRVRTGAMRRRVRAAFEGGSFAAAATALARELAELNERRDANHLVRHVLESAYRLTVFAPSLIAMSAERGLPSPAPHLARLLRLHLWGLATSAALDRRARPLHARGIAILAQDVPPITVSPDELHVGHA